MSNKYTFIGNNAVFLAKALYPIIPSLSKLVLVYYSVISETIEIKFINDSLELKPISDSFDTVFDITVIKAWRKKSKFEWLRRGEEPFSKENNIELDLRIESEKKKTILCLRVPCASQPGLYDLLFFYLKPDMTNFGPNSSNASISTESKNIIRIILENQIKQLVEMKESNLKAHARYNKMIQDSLIDYKSKINDMKSQIISFAIHYLNEMSSLGDYQYSLTNEAIEKLKDYSGDLHKLPEIIKDAADFALSVNPTKAMIMIDERFINLSKETKSEQTQQLHIRYPEVAAFLDNYEEAISLVLKDELEVKSSTVSKKLKPGGGGGDSAISQAIKLRRKKIFYLLTNYKNKWPLMRQHYRPIQTILYKGKGGFDDYDFG